MGIITKNISLERIKHRNMNWIYLLYFVVIALILAGIATVAVLIFTYKVPRYIKNSLSSKSFRHLDDLIRNGSKEIILDSDIMLRYHEKSKYPDGIRLDIDNLVIDGNGHRILARKKTRIFHITGKNITIKNIELKEGSADDGGAIFNTGSLRCKGLELVCNFAKNGGAIFSEGILKIENSVFSNNNARSGGALYYGGEATISNSKFSDNQANAGGAVFSAKKSSSNIEHSLFRKNNAIRQGGALFNEGTLNIDDCKFSYNDAVRMGGATFNGGTLSIYDSTLRNNMTSGVFSSGAAIYNEDELKVLSCVVWNNTSVGDGAVYNSGSLFISQSDISDNKANRNGGAIYNEGHLKLFSSTISDNSAARQGATVYNAGELTATDSKLSGNGTISQELRYEGAFETHLPGANNDRVLGGESATIYNCGEFRIYKSLLSDNKSENDSYVVYNEHYFNAFDCEILDNESSIDIFENRDYLEINNTLFKGNASKNIISNRRGESNLSVKAGRFIENRTEESVILNDGKSCTIERTHFENKLEDDENSKNISNQSELIMIGPKIKDGGKTILNDGHIIIKKSFPELQDKICGDGIVEDGRLIPVEQKLDFGYLDKKIHESLSKEIVLDEDIRFEDYEIDFYEGGIVLDIDGLVIDGAGRTIDGAGKSRIFLITGNGITLKNIHFKNGHSHKSYDNPLNNDGGCLKVNSNIGLSIENCEFTGNFSEENGGAITNRGNLAIANSKIHDNQANKNGGAVFNAKRSDLSIEASDLCNNSAQDEGGAISNHERLCINASNLTNNNASESGGAIDNHGKANINDCDFTDNGAMISGGAIDNRGDLAISNSALSGNSGDYVDGGAIHNAGDLNIKSSELSKNKASGHGGAIDNDGNLSVTDSTFTDNAAHDSGAIHNGGNLSVTDSTFTDNSAHDSGAIHNYMDASSSISDSSFTKNSAKYGGGAIGNIGELNIINSNLKDNSSGKHGSEAIKNRPEALLHITKSVLSGNSSQLLGGAIGNDYKATLEESELVSNAAERAGGAIWTKNSENINLNDCNFKDNDPDDVFYG